MVYPRRPRGMRRGRKAPARAGPRGRKSVGRRRQSVRRAKQGLPKRQMIQSSLGGLSLTRFVAARKPNAVANTIKRAGAPNFINITYPGFMKADGGVQTNSSWYLNAANDLRRIWASVQGLYTAKNGTTGAEYVASALPPPEEVPRNATFRICLESAISQLSLANTGTTPVNLEMYDIVAKRDSPQLPLDFGGQLVYFGGKFGQSTQILDPGVAWSVGMKNQTNLATGFETAAVAGFAGAPSMDNLGATPYQSKLFKDYFKVVRKSNVSLPIGGQHKHFVDLKPNVVFDNDMLSQNNVFKGVSFFTLIVASGVPVVKCQDTDETHPLRNGVADATTSAVSVSILQQVRYKWTWVEDARENIYRANYINYQNTSGAQTIQPSVVELKNADTFSSSILQQPGTASTFANQPSECTR